MQRIILHSDLNNFYASVECMINPDLRDKYVAVCGSQEERHGIVLAKNQLAKMKGVKTGEAIWEAKQKCPELVIVPPNYEEYLKYSKLVREIYYRYTDMIEPFGMDECWLDMTGSTGLFGTGYEIAYQIKETVKEELGLTVSIGVSYNKIFAKLGSDMKKPDAITCIDKDTFKSTVWPLPASDLLGVGRATKAKLERYGIGTIGNLAGASPDFLKRLLGINGVALWHYANGLDDSRVMQNDYKSPIKSIGHGITCIADLENGDEVWKVILELTQDISHKLRVNELSASGVSLAVKDKTLFYKEYQCKLDFASQSAMDIAKKAYFLFERNYLWNQNVRAITVRAINLEGQNKPQQLNIFIDTKKQENKERVELAMEKIRERFGKKSIMNAILLGDLKLPRHRDVEIVMPSPMYH